MPNDTAALIAAVRLASRVSNGSLYYEAGTILSLASDEQKTRIVPALLEARGGYLLHTVEVPLVAYKAAYRLPVRAIREAKVRLVDSAGKAVKPFERIASQLVEDVQPTQGRARYWLPSNNSVVLVPTPNGAGDVLHLGYYRWPSQLVEASECPAVTAVGASTLTVAGTLPSWLVVGAKADVVKGTPAFESLADDVTVTSVAGQIVTLSVPAGVEAGDNLCLAATTPFPQLPLAYHDVLVEATVARVHFEQGDRSAEASALARYERKLQAVMSTLSPRTEEPEVVVPGQDWF